MAELCGDDQGMLTLKVKEMQKRTSDVSAKKVTVFVWWVYFW